MLLELSETESVLITPSCWILAQWEFSSAITAKRCTLIIEATACIEITISV